MSTSILTKRGQTTIPREVRRALGLAPSDRISYRIEGDHVTMTAAEHAVDELFGVFKKDGNEPVDYNALRQQFATETALRVAEENEE